MQISIHIQDDLYKKVVESGVDMQSKFNEYLVTLLDKKESYINSKQFEVDKTYFNDALDEIESGKIQPLSHHDVWQQIDDHAKTH